MMSHQEPIHVVTTQWGIKYNELDVNRLFSMVRRNTTLPFCFHVFSNDELPGLHPDILKHPEPPLEMPEVCRKRNYRKTVGLCDPNLAGLTGKRIFVFDLDVLVMENLDELFTYPEGDKFYIIKDWNTRSGLVGQGSCYSLVVGTVGFIKEDFEKNPMAVYNRYVSATQQYLSAELIRKYGKLNFWPEAWFQSFQYHCLPSMLLRHVVTPRKPKTGTKVLAFHGSPGVQEAIAGQWSKPGTGKKAEGWKRLYKACKPVPWIEEYWRE